MNNPLSWLDTTLLQASELGSAIHVVRFLTSPTTELDTPFEGVCTVVIDTAVARIYGMVGRIHKSHLRALLIWLLKEAVQEVRAYRVGLHGLPGARKDGDWHVVDLLALKARLDFRR